MTVSDILKGKGQDVMRAEPAASLEEICQILGSKRIGALVVTDEVGAIKGIISERDIVRALGEKGASALQERADAIMTRNVVTCSADDTINAVMSKMSEGRFRHIPVEVDGKLAGIISIGDVVKSRIVEVEEEAEQIRTYITMA